MRGCGVGGGCERGWGWEGVGVGLGGGGRCRGGWETEGRLGLPLRHRQH